MNENNVPAGFVPDSAIRAAFSRAFGHIHHWDATSPGVIAFGRAVLALAAAPVAQPPATAESAAWIYRLNLLESCANWLESRSRCVTLNIKADPVEGGGYENLMRKYAEDLRTIRTVLATQPPAPVQQTEAVAPTWGYAKTVGNAIAQLQTMDPALPFYAALHLQDGRCIARGVTFSRERVVNERWIDNANKDVPYSIVVWSQPVESLYATPPAPALPPVARVPLTEEPPAPVLRQEATQAEETLRFALWSADLAMAEGGLLSCHATRKQIARALATPPSPQVEKPVRVAMSDERILELATYMFPRWREDIQERFVLLLAHAVLGASTGEQSHE